MNRTQQRTERLPQPAMVAAILLVAGCSPVTNEYAPPPPPTVTTAKPVQQDLTLFLEQNGETEPVDQAEVRSRVQGFVQEILFEPGATVKKGQELYKIEPDIYQAKRDSAAAAVEAAKAAVLVAQAAKATAEAEVKKAQSNFDREKRLLQSNAGSQSAFESAEASRDSATAQLGAAIASVEAEKANQLQTEAALAQTELDLQYTVVRAPIEGRVTKTEVKLGNLVDFGTVLATVVDQRKIFSNFSISDRKLLQLMDSRPVKQDQKNSPEGWSTIAVYLQRDPTKEEWKTGNLEYVEQKGIEESTGTFPLRAEFDNSEHDLVAGMFVMIRLPIEQRQDAILIPERAVSRSQSGEFLLVVGSDNKVERRPVTLGQKLDGWVLVEKGIKADEAFVLDGLQRARPGTTVTPTLTELSTADSPLLQASLTLESAAAEPEQETGADDDGDSNPDQ